ncbi:unnamed protein product [Candidula unifasciata]|uniref:Uncharacterized protein n=1 Tax=Candidula unifasciata TaxID=100452 RepID=A0A8S3YM03_9EUPU|nr:unnamed protein product [Candidula unifasciata]
MVKDFKSTLEGSLEKLPPRMKGLKKCIHVMLFLFIFGNDLADFVSDWLFFADVAIAEKGIVYGQPDRAAVWCLLLFSIIGTFTFLFECANLWWEFFRNNPWIDSDWLSAIVIWIEDIPQVLISMYLALCREEPISVFQLLKAAVILIGVVIRIIVTSVKYCNKEAVRSHYHVKIKAVIMIGIIIEACTAAAIFFLTQTERGNSGEVTFRVPSTVMEETFNDQRYFTNVSIFFHDADSFDVGNLDPNKTDYTVNWIRLTFVSDLRQSSHAPSFKIDYGYISSSIMNLAISEKRDGGNWTLSECYEIDIFNDTFADIKNTTCLKNIKPANLTSIFITLWYEKPGSLFKKKVFGDIHMDIHKLQGVNCSAVTQWEDTVENSVKNKVSLTFHYYRTSDTPNYQDLRHLLYQSGVPRFYRNIDSNLLDTRVIWKTGWNQCSCNGNFAPVLDTDQSLTCS